MRMIIAKDKKYLLKSALWLVFDPWKRQRDDREPDTVDLQNTDVINNYFAEQIYAYLTQRYAVDHKAIAISYSEISAHDGIHPLFADWNNLNNVEKIDEYMLNNQLTDLVICGFHHGMCTLYRPYGARYMRFKYNVYLKRDLTCCLTTSDTKNNIYYLDKNDQMSRKMFKEII